MKHCFFLRHLETINNHNQLLNGSEMNIPILERHPIPCEIAIDIIFCSTALRCRQTTEIFLENHLVHSLFYSDLLLERDLGILQGKDRYAAAKEYPNIFQGSKLNVFATPPGGETYEHFFDRAVKAKNWINQNSDNTDNILICSHNQFLKMLLFLFKKSSVDGKKWNELTFPYGKIVPIDLYK